MATVVLPPTLLSRIDDRDPLTVEGSTAGEILRGLEDVQPQLRGWILDESGQLRQHVALFVDNQRVSLDQDVEPGSELYVIQAISGGRPDPADRTELLIGTKKGLFVLQGPRGGPMTVGNRFFEGQTVDYACYDRRSGTYFAAMTHGQFGPHLYWSQDLTNEWTEAEGLAFPEDVDQAVERIWIIEPGEGDGEMWAGVARAALFHSIDHGRSWELVRGLWDQPSRPEWGEGLGGQALHSICPWPGEPEKLAVGISAAGVWLTDDGGKTWQHSSKGLIPRYIPEEARGETYAHCVHKMLRAPQQPDTLYMQFHGGVYRSDDSGRTWIEIGTGTGLPADFGFPLAIDPNDPDSAFVIPLTADVDRVTHEGKLRVYETRDRGTSWRARAKGLPQESTYLTILRQCFCQDGSTPLALYFGTKSGEVFGSADAGESWNTVIDHMPTIVAVQMGR